MIARSGIESRRGAERIIAEGRVTVNGEAVFSPATNVCETDRITLDGKPLPGIEPPRLWRYHKPTGLVTTRRDEKGRMTVFDNLPPALPRVMSIGRLDLTSEGLLLLTNDGGLKRFIEHPATGWIRRYRVRAFGRVEESRLERLRKGMVREGSQFGPMQIEIDSRKGHNSWLTVGLRQGRNREVRRAMEAIGLTVNRLIRVSFGPFQLGDLPPGRVREVRRRVLRDQVGQLEQFQEQPQRLSGVE